MARANRALMGSRAGAEERAVGEDVFVIPSFLNLDISVKVKSRRALSPEAFPSSIEAFSRRTPPTLVEDSLIRR